MNIFEHHKKEVALILDVGNGSIGVAVALLSSQETPMIIASIRDLVLFDERPTGDKLQTIILEKIIQSIPYILERAFHHPYFKNNSKHIEKILCVLSSPWFISKGKTIIVSQDKTFVITERFLEDILAKEMSAFSAEVTTDSKNSAEYVSDLEVVEKSIIGNKINGYVLDSALNQHTNHFEVSLYMSQAEKKFINGLSHIVSVYTHRGVADMTFHTFPLIVFSCVRDMFPGVSDYLHLDIAGEITDIAWVSGTMIKKNISFPSGKNLLIRQIAKHLHVPSEVARSFFHLYMDKRAEPSTEREIDAAIADAEKEWNIYIQDALSSLSEGGTIAGLPIKIFITAYPQTAEIFMQFLKKETIDETAEWRRSLSVTYIGPDILSKLCVYDAHETFDAFLSLEATFLSKFV